VSKNLEDPQFHHACHLTVVFASIAFGEGSFGSSTLEHMKEPEAIQELLETLLYKTSAQDYALQTKILHFLVVALSSNNSTLRDTVIQNLTSVELMHWIPERRRELELKKSAGLRRKFASIKDTKRENCWMVQNLNLSLQLLEGHSEFGTLVNLERSDVEQMTMDVPFDVWKFLHRSLELLIDLLSQSSSREYLVTYLDLIHFSVRARLAVGHHFAIPENLRLVQTLLRKINLLQVFPIYASRNLSKVDVISQHHARATILQKMAHRHFPRDLQSIIYAGVGLLCNSRSGDQQRYIEKAFCGFSNDNLQKLMYKMCLLPDQKDNLMTRHFMLQVLADYLSIPPYPMDLLKEYPLYPTETMLWDHSLIPPSSIQLRSSQVLALPKLNSKFLSFQDYLLRNFELLRLSSAYEIRSDLVNVVKRVKPLLRQSAIEDSEEGNIQMETEFAGWSRMAMELDRPFTFTEVTPPKLGDIFPQKVGAEIVIDLERCGNSLRREWDEIGEYENLFLVSIDASKMTGKSAPLLKDYHLHHGEHKMWDSDDGQRRIADEEDSTFCQRFGITLVRGCMVLQVQNEARTILSDPGAQVPEDQKDDTKRIFKVAMDSAQYILDKKAENGTDSYKVSVMYLTTIGKTSHTFNSLLSKWTVFFRYSNSTWLLEDMGEKIISNLSWKLSEV
jgi:intron-binding protein aquarius